MSHLSAYQCVCLCFNVWVEQFPHYWSAWGFPGSAGVGYSWWLHCDDGRGSKAIDPSPCNPTITTPHQLPKTLSSPINMPLCGDIITLADKRLQTPGAFSVSMWPHASLSTLHTHIQHAHPSTSHIPPKYFLKNNIVYYLVSNIQASVNVVMSQQRTEEQLINVKPSVYHHTCGKSSYLKAVLFLDIRN